MKPKLVLIGGGGHCKSCIDVLEMHGGFEIVGILDQSDNVGKKVLGYEIIGTDDAIAELARQGHSFLITVGQVRSGAVRKKLFALLEAEKATAVTVVSPLAYVSRHARIGKGTVIMHHAVVNADAEVGMNCIINTKALVEHDATIESHCHISTSAVINGGAVVKEGTFFGSGAVCKEYVETGADDFIKAGTVYKGYQHG